MEKKTTGDIPSATVGFCEEYVDRQCRAMNEAPGSLGGYDCPECRNKGFVYFVRNGEIFSTPCRCRNIRESLARIRRSGLEPLLDRYTFDRFETTAPWQHEAKRTAMDYVSGHREHWLLICGQSGSGKTHLCTAAVGALLRGGADVLYMLWRDEATRLKSRLGGSGDYAAAVRPFKEAGLLYIDDFLKTSGGGDPTAGDLHLAFEILNARYTRPDRLTVLSCERTLDDILRADEALGSRIFERTGPFAVTIAPDPGRNYRLHKGH